MIQSHGTGVLLGDYFKSDSQPELHHETKGKSLSDVSKFEILNFRLHEIGVRLESEPQ